MTCFDCEAYPQCWMAADHTPETCKFFRKELPSLEEEIKYLEEYLRNYNDPSKTLEPMPYEVVRAALYAVKRETIAQEALRTLRTRCHESARDAFDRGAYGLLHIVGIEELRNRKNAAEEME